MFRHSDSDVQGMHRRGAGFDHHTTDGPSRRGLGSAQVLITDSTKFMTTHGFTGRRAAAAPAGIALAMGCVPLAFADPGGNDKNFIKHLAVDSPSRTARRARLGTAFPSTPATTAAIGSTSSSKPIRTRRRARRGW